SLAPATMARIGTVDERYQSYNVEMIEVTGGRFWKPYGAKPEASANSTSASPPSGSDTPGGMNPDLYQYRPPIDLRSARLRRLAAALGPAYLRVSGTWANTTYFPESDKAPERTRRSRSTGPSAMSSNPADRCGSPRPPTPPAEGIPGRRRSWTRSAIWTSSAVSLGRAFRWSRTTRWSPATMASSTRVTSRQSRSLGGPGWGES